MRPTFVAVLSASFLACADSATEEPVDSAMLVDDTPVCSDIRRSGEMRLAPTSPDLLYRRCGTVAGENAWSVTLSPDHQRLAARTNVGTVRLVDTEDFHEIAELAAPIGELSAAAFSPDGALLATVGNDESRQLTIWNAHDGTALKSALVPSFLAGGKLAFSSDGTQVATSAQTLFDLATGTMRPWGSEPGGGSTFTRALTFLSADRQILWLATVMSGTIDQRRSTNLLWLTELATGKRTVLHRLAGSRDAPPPYALSDDKRLLAVSGSDASSGRGLRLLAAGTAEPLAIDPDGTPTVLAFSHDGRELYTLNGGTLEAREIPSLKPIRHLPWTGGRVLGLSPEGLLVSSKSTGMEWRDPKTAALVRTASTVLSEVTWSVDGALGAGVGAGTLLRVWRENDGEERCRIATPTVSFPTLRPRPPNQPTFPTPEEWSRPIDRPLGPWKVSQSEDGTVAFVQRYLYRDIQGYTYGRTVEEVATNRVLRRFTPRLHSPEGELSADGSKLITVEGYRYMPLWCR